MIILTSDASGMATQPRTLNNSHHIIEVRGLSVELCAVIGDMSTTNSSPINSDL